MKVTIEFNEEINTAIQEHLDNGTKVQCYIIAAVKFFNDMRRKELEGNTSIGFGRKENFERYNTIASPSAYLESAIILRKENDTKS